MKHVFVLNPAAGKHAPALELAPYIREVCEKHGVDFEILQTTAPGDATTLSAKAIAESGERVRLYACGGDGTLLEVLTAIAPYSDTEFAHIPCGSGNDFVRMLGGAAPYLELEEMMTADAYPMDGIVCTYGEGTVRRSLNIAATGMDAEVAYHMAKFKRWPLVSGSMAYNLALVKVFFSRLGCHLTVEMETADGVQRVEGNYLFALCANGEYYGGGYHGVPTARPDDGQLDFVLVDKMSRARILQLLPKYKKGTHKGERGMHFFRGTAITVKAARTMPVTLDGECVLTDRFRAEIEKGAYRMAIPRGVADAWREKNEMEKSEA